MVSAVAIGQVGKGDKADKLSTWELNEGTVVDIFELEGDEISGGDALMEVKVPSPTTKSFLTGKGTKKGGGKPSSCGHWVAFGNTEERRNGGWCKDSASRIDHPLMLLHLPRSVEGLLLLAGQDLVHVLWRWRRQLLDPKKTLHLHQHLISRRHLVDVPWLSESMLDYKNKQDWPAVQAIFSISDHELTAHF